MFIANEVFITNKINNIEDGDKLIRKYGKLLKIGKLLNSLKLFKIKNLKSKKLFKSQKLAKLRKKLSKSGKLCNFNTRNNSLSFLISNIRIAFNYL